MAGRGTTDGSSACDAHGLPLEAAQALRPEHVGDERAAMKNTVLLACQGVHMLEHQGQLTPD